MSEIEVLQEKIKNLEEQVRLYESGKTETVIKVQEVKIIEPSDYQDNKKRVKYLEKKCKSLENVIRYGQISSVDTLIDEYQGLSKRYLDKIIREMEFYLASAEERQALIKFISYLQFIEQQLQQFLFVDEEKENGII